MLLATAAVAAVMRDAMLAAALAGMRCDAVVFATTSAMRRRRRVQAQGACDDKHECEDDDMTMSTTAVTTNATR